MAGFVIAFSAHLLLLASCRGTFIAHFELSPPSERGNMDFWVGGVLASMTATAIWAAFIQGWGWIWRFPGPYVDLRGEWIAVGTVNGIDQAENIYVQRQLRSRFRGKIGATNPDGSRFYMDVRGQFHDQQVFTYTHYQPSGPGVTRNFGTGAMQMIDNSSATGKALFIGTHGQLLLNEPTVVEVDMRRIAGSGLPPTV